MWPIKALKSSEMLNTALPFGSNSDRNSFLAQDFDCNTEASYIFFVNTFVIITLFTLQSNTSQNEIDFFLSTIYTTLDFSW